MNSEDLINELFPFKKPLTSRYRKKYVEFLALGILQYCYGDTYVGFNVYDAPDIRDENKVVGIEVTEAVTKEEAQIEGEFVKYRLESRLEQKERRKQIIENNGAKVNELGLTYPVKDGDSEKLIFQDAIRKKMKKLASYRQQGFEKVGLFVFYDEPPIPIHLEELKNCFDEVLNEYRDKYDVIYFGYSCGLIEYDILLNSIQVQPIERNAYNKLQYEARLKVEA
ncbi:MAG: hypothetical protein K2I03_00900 [Lachnospiraceae bacterium]|nr:hypothetical protein [Lachnospiraceae bacterium]